MPSTKRIAFVWALFVSTAALALPAAAQKQPAENALQIYFVDVEGGQSTLIVTPTGESLLIDAGWAGPDSASSYGAKPGNPQHARDAQRILAAARDAGVTAINVLLVTHFHADHDGGVPELKEMLPILTFIDHGSASADIDEVPGSLDAFRRYQAVRNTATHLVAKVGDRIPLPGANITVVSSNGSILNTFGSGTGAPNGACDLSPTMTHGTNENSRSVGVRLTFGRFRFVDLGDLVGVPLFNLFCPNDLLGPIDVYVLPHHGAADGGAIPRTVGVVPPRVAIMNNAATKGGAPEMLALLHRTPGEDVWQLHRSIKKGAENFPEARIANLDDHLSTASPAYWIKVTAHRDGSFVVTNPRTGTSRNYPPAAGRTDDPPGVRHR